MYLIPGTLTTFILRTNVKVRTLLLFPQYLGEVDLSALTAIWIYGIFTLAEIHRTRFWDTLSHLLKQRGQDYVDRCTIRTDPRITDNVVSPIQFPPLPELDPDAEGASPSVSEEDMKEVSNTLVYFEQDG